ncbi:MAG: tRNA 2-thiouridine(34) synthase MnmA [Deltaproteobacteria bacterium]|nr:tRNA 2-thiouridine(34) synthase MnmA [Deltaproteobacteria bacterium]
MEMTTHEHRKTVIAGMSGGVDSSVAALLLKEQGYVVKGVALKLWAYRSENPCCSTEDLDDAAKTARQIGIEFEILDMQRQFKEIVVDYYGRELSCGRTPNPCVVCNDRLKFGLLLDYALQNKYDYVATGHYVRVRVDGQGYHLERALDPNKDQSYFLFMLDQQRLARALFPLGGLEKGTVRELARKAEFVTCSKRDSQELCFLPEGGLGEFVKWYGPLYMREGEIRNGNKVVVGRHRGLPFYTIGQRRGLGLYTSAPVYVINKNTADNSITIGTEEGLLSGTFSVRGVHWISGAAPSLPLRADVKIRYRHSGKEAEISKKDDRIIVKFDSPQKAITPGQAAVFYRDNEVLGGGWIWEVEEWI